MTNLQRFLANEPGLSTTGVREELLGLMRDVGVMVEAFQSYREWQFQGGGSTIHQEIDRDKAKAAKALAQKYEWFKEVV